MIEKLTAEILKEYGFSESHIGDILDANVYEQNCPTMKGEYFVSKSEMLIYSGNERFLKTGQPMLMFPFYNINLIPEYFQQLLEVYLKKEKTDLGITFYKEKAIERFKQSEIRRINDAIKKQTECIGIFNSSSLRVKQYNGYIDWLNELKADNQPPVLPENNIVEWERFIDPLVLISFLDVEKKATEGTGKFETAIRCAAFCEMIYYGKKLLGKPFMIQTKTPIITMADFALCRYNEKIKASLNSGEKKKQRLEHQTRTKKGLPPLKNSF